MSLRLRKITSKVELNGKRVLLRAGLNVPLKKSDRGGYLVADDSRLKEAAPTIVRLSKAGARLIIMAHLGRPQGRVAWSLRMAPVVKRLREYLYPHVAVIKSIDSWNFLKIREQVDSLKNGEVLVLENLRFHPGEELNSASLAKQLASLADVYVNEAFSNSHRKHASMSAITKYLPSYAGWHLVSEIAALHKIRVKPRRPFVLVIGGAKVKDKLDMILNLAPKVGTALVGGIAANTMLKMMGVPIGCAKVDAHPPLAALKRVLKIVKQVPRLGKVSLIQLPDDLVVATDIRSNPRVVDLTKGERVRATENIFDIGPKTVQKFATYLKRAETIVWDGPMGVIEVPPYDRGSVALAQLIAARSRGRAYGVVGGGETLEVIERIRGAGYIDYRSTGGGAMLDYLAGKKLPGLEPLLK